MSWMRWLKRAIGWKWAFPRMADRRTITVAEPLPPEVEKRMLCNIRRSLHTLDATRQND